MPHEYRHVASLLLAVTTVISPVTARAAAGEASLVIAQAPPPPPEEEDNKAKKSEDREQRRQQKNEQRQDRREQRMEGQQDRSQDRNERQQRQQQERARQQDQNQKERDDRQQQQKALQEQQRQDRDERQQQKKTLQEQQRQERDERQQQKALQEQQRQERDAKQQQQNERLQQDRVRQEKLLDEQRRDAKQQESERQRTDREQDKLRQDQARDREKDRFNDQTRQRDADRVKQDDDRRRDADRTRNEERFTQPPPGAAQSPDTTRRGDSPASVDRTADPEVRERNRVRRQEIRESYRKAPRQERTFDDLKRNRRERTVAEGKLRVIEEPDRRVIVKQDNRTFIRHDESERFRRIAPDARTIRRADGTSTTFMTRQGGIRIYDVTDRHGRLLYRYRRYPDNREVVLIDNRRYYRRDKNRTRDVLIGAGIGLVIGSAIALSAPEVRIPRDEYIVDYGRASDDDLYEALTAPPIERLERGYSLEEIRYSRHLRDRMRRIDLDTVTFDFGSWEVGPDQGRALDRLADGINRVLSRNQDEIFMIEGHTDAVGSEEDNLTLSDRRAQSVAEILTTDYGVAPENLVTQGYGEEQLKVPTDGPERANRRITVRRIGPLLSGRGDADRYSGSSRDDDRSYGDDADADDGRYDDRR